MKKALFFIAILFAITSCNTMDEPVVNTQQPESKDVLRFAGVAIPDNGDEITSYGVSDKTKRWTNGAEITVKILNNNIPLDYVDIVKSAAAEWQNMQILVSNLCLNRMMH